MKPMAARFGAGVALAIMLGSASPGYAWKPFTHNFTGDQARADVVDDGNVTIDGREYAVRPEIVQALRNWPAYYNAGVIGPDGFPDLTYGQSVIHSVHTGEWLRLIYSKAWEAQSDALYSAAEKSQILAFAYGFMTHAAGDLWGHTLINDFSDPSGDIGVFPSVLELLNPLEPESALRAVRHIAAEGYIGGATPGWDSDRERGPAPGGDVSDDNTPGVAFAAPKRFIYETLIDPRWPTPWDPATTTPKPVDTSSSDAASQARGPLLGRFLRLQAWVNEQNGLTVPDPIETAMGNFQTVVDKLAAMECACNFGVSTASGCSDDCCFGVCNTACDVASDFINCPAAAFRLGFGVIEGTAAAFADLVALKTATVALNLWQSYTYEWSADLDSGLRNWSDLGLGITQGLFDPQTRRDYQNETCSGRYPDESSAGRATCEAEVGAVDVVMWKSSPFITGHMLSMAGLPDFVGDIVVLLGRISDYLDVFFDSLGPEFEPIRLGIDGIKAWVKQGILDSLSKVLGIDIEQIAELLKDPSRLVCAPNISLTLPIFGKVDVQLFPDGTHARLDGILGLPPEHHIAGQPDTCGPLTAKFDPDRFAPIRNTITTAKLLLLDGDGMNHVLGDILGRQIATYGPQDNIMIQSLQSDAWLQLIDGDHAWREDGSPVFGHRANGLTGGSGQFPPWESCVLRPAFRRLYRDWENQGANFPDLGDVESADLVNDPNSPTGTLTRTGVSFESAGVTFVAADNAFVHVAHDTPAGRAFEDDELGLRHRVYRQGDDPGVFEITGQGARFSIVHTLGDGDYVVEAQSQDHCHPYDGTGLKAPEAVLAQAYTLDTKPPVVTCLTPPSGLTYPTDAFATADVTILDGGDGSRAASTSVTQVGYRDPIGEAASGSGVASASATLDGYRTSTGVAPIELGGALDMYQLYPGVRSVTIVATDNLGNSGITTCTFQVHATIGSLQSNLDRALREGSIDKTGIHSSLKAKLEAAMAAASRGSVGASANIMRAFVNELEAQSGKGFDPEVASRFIAWAQELASVGGPR